MHTEPRIAGLLAAMTLDEKIGQLWQVNGAAPEHRVLAREGRIGSILNLAFWKEHANPAGVYNDFQRAAVAESRLGIPLLIGRDVIHGFRTVFPIPLGQAASFDPGLVRDCARVAAREAAACGINWTFAPMVDVARDPRWGRVAESPGEDPLLASRMGAAMVAGFQGDDLAGDDTLAACAKHFVGYGAAEGGRDYNTVQLSDGMLRDVYLAPFAACVQAGVATVMSAFHELNGVPASGNAYTLRQILKETWGFDGFVISDWGSVTELINHGFSADPAEAARTALAAGVDMEMVSRCYVDHVRALLDQGAVALAQVDEAVARILRVKLRLGLFEQPYRDESRCRVLLDRTHLEQARRAAAASCVLLKNNGVLPLAAASLRRIAVIGPLADAPADQLGCWAMDGDAGDTVTPLAALRARLEPACRVDSVPALATSRATDTAGFAAAVEAATAADAVLLFLGEEAVLSGEAHCRACLDLPGAQDELVSRLAATGKPLVVVVLAGRPLVVDRLAAQAAALLWAWHPGTQGGPAIVDLLLGDASPEGRLPISFPAAVGQIPVYHAHPATGRPPVDGSRVGVPTGTPLDPQGFTSSYLDCDHRPLFPFGFGLTYGEFVYRDLTLDTERLALGDTLTVQVTLTNKGRREAVEVAQLYVRDCFGSRVRPVRELKDFQRVRLAPGASTRVCFRLHTDQLAFHGADGRLAAEPGAFRLWVGGCAEGGLEAGFTVVATPRT